jgi:hypothetical protein
VEAEYQEVENKGAGVRRAVERAAARSTA